MRTQIEDLLSQLNNLKVEHQKEVNSKELLINQQKAEILQAMADKLEADKAKLEAQSKVDQLTAQLEEGMKVSSEKIQEEEHAIVEQIAELSQKLQEEKELAPNKERTVIDNDEKVDKPKKKDLA